MNRRAFMKSVGVSAAAGAINLGVTRRVKAQSAGPNPAVYNASGAAHAIAAGNYYFSTPTANDWTTIRNTLSNVITDWTDNGLDAQVQAALPNISASTIRTANLNQQSILAQAQLYQPAFTLAQV